MTESKMTNVLIGLVLTKGAKKVVFKTADFWNHGAIREDIFLGEIALAFIKKDKTNYFYNKYRYTGDFNQLLKIINQKDPMIIPYQYSDTKDEWFALHRSLPKDDGDEYKKRVKKLKGAKVLGLLDGYNLTDEEKNEIRVIKI